MERDKFIDALALYGSDLTRWPEELMVKGERALEVSSSLRSLQDAEAAFEAVLLSNAVKEPNPYLEERIIARALDPTNAGADKKTGLAGLLGFYFHGNAIGRAALSMIIILLIGYMVGSMGQSSTNNNASTDEEAIIALLLGGHIDE